MMDYTALDAADWALGIEDLAAAADALNAQTREVIGDIPTSDARAVLLLSGEWFKVKQLAKRPLTNTAADEAIAAADIAIDTLTLTETIHASDPAQWAVVQRMAEGLIAAGVLSRASLNAWGALRVRQVPVWPEPVTAGTLQTLRSAR